MDDNIILSFYEEFTRDYRTRYIADITNKKYAEHKIIRDYDQNIVHQKVEKLIEKWQQMESKEKNTTYAQSKTIEIKKLNQQLDHILIDGLVQNIDVLKLYNEGLEAELSNLSQTIKDTKSSLQKFHEFGGFPRPPKEVKILEYPVEPQGDDYIAKYTLLHKVVPLLRRFVDIKNRRKFKIIYQKYEQDYNRIKEINKQNKKRYKIETKIYRERLLKYQKLLSDLDSLHQQEEEYLHKKQEVTSKIISLKERVVKGEHLAIEEYSSLLLASSVYPIEWGKYIIASYKERLLAIDYSLPSIDTFPSLTEMKFTKGQCIAVSMTEKAFAKHYEESLYKIALRSLHEIFADKYLMAVNAVVFNGWVTALNKANGRNETNCIMSIKTNREQINAIDFHKISPKACFKSLKGISSSVLSTITAIKPIVILNQTDKRFVECYNIGVGIDNSTNLAAMYWKDFEHLIRELFEKEFSQSGGAVKVTRASRDGGVDAIAFDPDPIRGGKIVIQAKRYTNTVGVSAVRDLYGTVLNEGATKGILVTTSDYGGDSYEFAKDKPITLMNGANLLYLLEKHGQHARIDINEARQLITNFRAID